MKTSRVLILVCLGVLVSFGLGFLSGWQAADGTDRLLFGHALVARDEVYLDGSCMALRDFKDGKIHRTTAHLQSQVDYHLAMLEGDFSFYPNQRKKEVDTYKSVIAVAKEMQRAWRFEPGSFESTNGPTILSASSEP